MRGLLNRLLLLLLLAAASLPARAACLASALSVSFGSYNPQSATALDSTGQVTVTCTGIGLLVSYDVQLSKGGAANFAPRQLSLSSHRLSYNLYTSSARSAVWGDGSGGTSVISDGYVLSLGTIVRNYTVYGRVPAQQNIAAGAYADTVVVTVMY